MQLNAMRMAPRVGRVNFLIVGCGFTGRRVAAGLAAEGHAVWATSRHPERLALPGVCCLHLDLEDQASLVRAAAVIPERVRVLLSIPLIEDDVQGWAGDEADGLSRNWHDPTPRLLEALGPSPERLVYLSTTAVYGAQVHVDEMSPTAPRGPREQLRVEAERAVQSRSSSDRTTSMILRPAAIYGPGRGVHESMRRGTFRLPGDGTRFISRIHVDDLAALVKAALLCEHSGAWPVADEEPCSSLEICRFVSNLTGLPMPEPVASGAVSETLRNNRQVDGRAVLRLLGVRLRYASYRTGIPACLAAEKLA